jgi:hypothetical protein
MIFLDAGGDSMSALGPGAASKAEADELLIGLQVPAFLKFVQTRHPDKIPMLFTEKVLSQPPSSSSSSSPSSSSLYQPCNIILLLAGISVELSPCHNSRLSGPIG